MATETTLRDQIFLPGGARKLTLGAITVLAARLGAVGAFAAVRGGGKMHVLAEGGGIKFGANFSASR